MTNLKKQLKDEIPGFKAQGEAFLKGELKKMDFKKISGGFGVYAHRDGKKFMIRLRIPSGVISKEQLSYIYEICKKHNIDHLHITTRQAVQLHGLEWDTICNVMEEALDYNIYTRGAGGNYPRNVAMSPLSGVDEEDVFDVLPYALVAGNYFLQRITTYKLPRKLKVSFSSNYKDESHATVQDVGFVATCEEGKEAFCLYLGGGLGRNPRQGVKYPHLIDKEDVLYIIEAATRLFIAEGDYQNHAKARMRYIVERLGEEAFIKIFDEHLQEVYKEDLKVKVDIPFCRKVGSGQEEPILSEQEIMRQKQKGLYSYYFHPIGGQLDLEILGKILEVVRHIEDIQIRLSMSEGMYFINLTADEVKRVQTALESYNALTALKQSHSCIGVPICQMGVLNSQKMLRMIIDHFKDQSDLEYILPSLYISGCQNSCGVHQIGDIGLVGHMKRIQDKMHNVFELFLGGNCLIGDTRLGVSYGFIKEEEVAACLEALAMLLKDRQMSIGEIIKKDHVALKEVIKHYDVNK